jgi:hypothetical protein
MAAEPPVRNAASDAVRRRTVDRHYLGVVSAEARRLARELRASGAGRGREDRRVAEDESSEDSH